MSKVWTATAAAQSKSSSFSVAKVLNEISTAHVLKLERYR